MGPESSYTDPRAVFPKQGDTNDFFLPLSLAGSWKYLLLKIGQPRLAWHHRDALKGDAHIDRIERLHKAEGSHQNDVRIMR